MTLLTESELEKVSAAIHEVEQKTGIGEDSRRNERSHDRSVPENSHDSRFKSIILFVTVRVTVLQ